MTFRVLLVTTMRWPFAARLASAFAGQGAHVEALCPPGHMLAASRYPSRLYAHHPLFPRLAEALALGRPDLVVPCDDPAAQLLWRFGAKASPSVKAQLARSLGDADIIGRLTCRNLFLEQAQAAGVRIGATVPVSNEDDVESAITKLSLPVVVKADHSWGGDGVVIAHDAHTALAAYRRFAQSSRLRDIARAMRRREPHLLARALFPERVEIGLQQFIPGRPATSSIACWRGTLLAANHFDVAVAQGTGPATVVSPVVCLQMADAARRIARHFNLTGLFGLDYMRGQDGKTYLLEINPRATPTAHLALAADPVAALLAAAGGGGEPRSAVTTKSQIALFPQEWSRDHNSPFLDTAFHDVPRDDPGLVAACLGSGAAFNGKNPQISAENHPGGGLKAASALTIRQEGWS